MSIHIVFNGDTALSLLDTNPFSTVFPQLLDIDYGQEKSGEKVSFLAESANFRESHGIHKVVRENHNIITALVRGKRLLSSNLFL